jgi:hypothetical protein
VTIEAAPFAAAAASSPTTPLWVTILVGTAGAVTTLVGVLITQWVTTRREKARSADEAKRQESHLLKVEGRAAISAFLAAATAFEDAARLYPRREDDAVRKALVELDIAVARVQITCSVKVADMASGMVTTATLIDMYDGNPDNKRSEVVLRFKSRHRDLIRAVREELGLNEPEPGVEPSKSWLVAGPAKSAT